MPYEYVIAEIWSIIDRRIGKAFEALTQKSVIWLILQGALLAFSLWDKNSRLFVILAAIGVYSVYGSLSVRISIEQRELAAERLNETRYRQYILAAELRHKKPQHREILFIPEISKEDGASHVPNYQSRQIQIKSERNYIYG